jgi:hypothetical protein
MRGEYTKERNHSLSGPRGQDCYSPAVETKAKRNCAHQPREFLRVNVCPL